MRSTVFFVCCLLFLGVSVRAADYSQQLLAIMELVEAKDYPEAIAGYEKFLQQAPKALQGAVQFEIATLHAAQGNKDRALAMMEQAIQAGFDDCLALEQYEELKSIKNAPRFSELQRQVRISEANLKELHWLKAEIEHVNHDIKMIISENMNRVDTGITAIPQSTVPTRETASPGVLFNREILKMMHQVQRQYVSESDKMRMEHVGSMTVISGTASHQRVAESSRLADRAAEERKRAINARKFSLPPGVGTTPRSCSEWK
ncbi:MAG: hypothetical protein EHM23_29085 [Acidobacteria bacterium]|nr:MAG: hypothetical protein EHM23_29085 [Acidobacteriota bacterium]